MKRMLLAALLGVFTLPGCIVAVESRTHRVVHDPPPPPPREPEVVVEWTSARTVIVREYYDCDWDTVGYFDYYERECGIPEDDLFFLLHVSRTCGRPFNEVVFTYSSCDRQLFRVVQHYRINHWDLYVDLPVGTACPPAYQRAYGYYWYRSRYPTVVLTNYDCHALFWLRFGVFYYGWQPRECFTRWDGCVDNRVSFVTVVHREYQAPRRVAVYNWARRPVTVIDRRECDVKVIENRRREVYKKVEVDCDERSKRGERIVRALPPQERERHIADQKREWENERRREVEVRRREPQKFEEYKKHDNRKPDPQPDHGKDQGHKGDLDDRRDDRRAPPPPPPKRDDGKKNDPRKNESKKNEPKKDEPKKDDAKKDDDHGKNPPKDDKKDDRKGEDRRDDRRDDRDDRRDDRKDDRKKDDDKKDDGKKDDGKKNDGGKKDDGKKDDGKKDDGKKDDGKKDNGKKDEGKKDGGKKDKQSPPRQQAPPPQRAPERKQPEQKQEAPQRQEQKQPGQKQQEQKPEKKQDDRKRK